MITRHQISAARALLEWNQDDLANASGVSKDMISKIEGGKSSGSLKSLQALENSIIASGIEFSEHDGVRRSATKIKVLKGKTGFIEFFDDVFEEVRSTGIKEVLVTNVDERKFVQWQGDQLHEHSSRMVALDTHYKILIQHGDTYFPASSYAEYKWMPAGLFNTVPYYLYGKKVAMLIFSEHEPRIYILNEPELYIAHKKQFNDLWEQSTKPEIPNG